jgi:uncharacterized protein YdhG (YjbR/CyaY superfamily)
MPKFKTIDAYIASFPPGVQATLENVRAVIHETVPGATEGISYDIAGFALQGRYFVTVAGWKRHFSLYPIPGADAAFDRRLDPYKSGKGTLKFPLDQPVPVDIIRGVVERLVEQRVRARS